MVRTERGIRSKDDRKTMEGCKDPCTYQPTFSPTYPFSFTYLLAYLTYPTLPILSCTCEHTSLCCAASDSVKAALVASNSASRRWACRSCID